MTNEEALKRMKWTKGRTGITSEEAEAIGYAIEKLSNSDEDCISREEVCDYIAEFVNHEYATDREHEMVEHIIGGIQHFSSVQPKTGHWKFIQRGKFIDICCSECGYVRVYDFAYGYTINQLDKESVKEFFSKHQLNFCECCGAKMEDYEKT